MTISQMTFIIMILHGTAYVMILDYTSRILMRTAAVAVTRSMNVMQSIDITLTLYDDMDVS